MILLIFLVGVIAGLADLFAGVGGLIAVPFLITIGLPPYIAISTDRLGVLGSSGGSLFRFVRTESVIWSLAFRLVGLSVVGAWIGANILLSINEETVTKIIGLILLITLPFILKNSLGLHHHEGSSRKKYLGYFCYFLLSVYAGFLGIGTGPFTYLIMMGLFGLTITEGNATHQVVLFIQTLVSLIVFTQYGTVRILYGIPLFLGSAAGGFIGARLVVKKGNWWHKQIFVFVVIVAAIKLLLA